MQVSFRHGVTMGWQKIKHAIFSRDDEPTPEMMHVAKLHAEAVDEREFFRTRYNTVKDSLEEAIATNGPVESVLGTIEEISRDPSFGSGGNWNRIGSIDGAVSGREQSSEDRAKMIEQSRKFYQLTSSGRNAIESHINYIIGRGCTMKSVDNDDISNEWVQRFELINNMRAKKREIILRSFRDGTMFTRFYPVTEKEAKGPYQNGDMLIRFVAAEDIAHIELNEKDHEKVDVYYKADENGAKGEEIDPKEMTHLKMFADSDCAWGRTLLEPVANKIQNYEMWLRNRMILNTLRTSVLGIRSVTAVEGQYAKTTTQLVDGMEKSSKSGSASHYRLPAGGTIINLPPGVKFELVAPNIYAADAKDDGRAILLQIAAGLRSPEFVITADSSNSNFSSTLVAESPWLINILEYQQQFGGYFEQTYSRSLKSALAAKGVTSVTVKEMRLEAIEARARHKARLHTVLEDHGEDEPVTGAALMDLEATVMRIDALLEDDDSYETIKREPSGLVKAEWPDLVTRDAEKQARSLLIDRQMGIVSKSTAATRRGYGWDQEQKLLDEEKNAGPTTNEETNQFMGWPVDKAAE